MAQTAPELEQINLRFRQQLEKMGIHAEQVLLYGSRAAGPDREGSDIDLIVISTTGRISINASAWSFWGLPRRGF